MEELEHILSEVNTHILSSPSDLSPTKTIAGGSVANTIRGLAAGFGVSCGIIGAFADDEQGNLFINNMSSYGVNLSRLRMKSGHTAQVSVNVSCYSLYQCILFLSFTSLICWMRSAENLLQLAQCVCLVDALGNRTMRPCLSSAVKVQVHTIYVV